MFFRRFLSFILMLLAIGCFGAFVAFLEVHQWAENCEVSQVFKQVRSVHLAGDNYVGLYDVAVTPLTAANKLAQVCRLVTLTPAPYLNLLDKKVWLVPTHEFQFAFYETPVTQHFLYLLLGVGVVFLLIAYFLFDEKDS